MKVAAGQLSGGEQQMLALGRALALKPRALLVDELSMGLAPAVAESILAVIRKIAMEKGIAVLLVEQHIASALAFADRATVLVRGRIVLNGDAADLARPGEVIEAAYLGANVGSDRS
jgi:branched-chain amino acid transport system ATP-binding protein